MIKVSNISKSFDGFTAVDDVSFQIKKGEVIGFLGPNGAGKTTTMRLMMGFLTADSGEILFDGKSIQKDFKQIISQIGYLPEHNPLYDSMRVDEFLLFEAKLRGDIDIDKIKEIVEQTGLTDKVTNKIGTLSKGYKQRVGIAKALIGDIEYLILDEPTTGLDPIQKDEIIELIKKISKNKTILFSSHILSEVSKIADKVLIINDGSLIAQGTEESLMKKHFKDSVVELKTTAPKTAFTKSLKSNKLVKDIRYVSSTGKYKKVLVQCDKPEAVVEDIFGVVVKNKWKISEMSIIRESLETLFKDLINNEG